MDWPGEYVDGRGHLHLRGTRRHLSMMKLLREAHRCNSSYDMRFYSIVDEDLPIASIDSKWIRVARKEVDPITAHRTKKRPKRAPPPRNALLLGDLDALADDEREPDDAPTPTDSDEERSDTKSDPPKSVEERSLSSGGGGGGSGTGSGSSDSSSDSSNSKCLTESSHKSDKTSKEQDPGDGEVELGVLCRKLSASKALKLYLVHLRGGDLSLFHPLNTIWF